MALRKQLKEKNNNQIPNLERYKILDAIRLCKHPRDKAFIALLYLTGCRISEVVKQLNAKPPYEVIGEPLRKKHVELRDDHIIIRNVRTLKLRKIKLYRSIPIPKNSLESPFIAEFMSYFGSIKEEDAYLFEITRQRGWQILTKTGLFPHILRHARNSHLVQDYDFTVPQLQQFNGWSRAETPTHYVHLNVKDLLKKMLKTDNLSGA